MIQHFLITVATAPRERAVAGDRAQKPVTSGNWGGGETHARPNHAAFFVPAATPHTMERTLSSLRSGLSSASLAEPTK